jgi:hypothetical protein
VKSAPGRALTPVAVTVTSTDPATTPRRSSSTRLSGTVSDFSSVK